jgi:hypothetical protein
VARSVAVRVGDGLNEAMGISKRYSFDILSPTCHAWDVILVRRAMDWTTAVVAQAAGMTPRWKAGP